MKHLLTLTSLITIASGAQAANENTHRNQAPDGNQGAAAVRSTHYPENFEPRTFKGSNQVPFKYGWLAPARIKTGETYPLLIAMHGSGTGQSRATTILSRSPMREKYPVFILAGECDRPTVWAHTPALKRPGRPENPPEKLPVMMEAIRALIQTEAIDPTRIYITGQSMGGVGTWGAISRHSDVFAAAVPICGAWDVAEAPKMVAVPVWAFHGAEDPNVPATYSREITKAIAESGGVVKYTEYPETGHDSWTKACDEPALWEWLFAQRKGKK